MTEFRDKTLSGAVLLVGSRLMQSRTSLPGAGAGRAWPVLLGSGIRR